MLRQTAVRRESNAAGFAITWTPNGEKLEIAGNSPRGELYGVFQLVEAVASEHPIASVPHESPAAPICWTDEWDNLNGAIERGYAAKSIFFSGGDAR